MSHSNGSNAYSNENNNFTWKSHFGDTMNMPSSPQNENDSAPTFPPLPTSLWDNFVPVNVPIIPFVPDKYHRLVHLICSNHRYAKALASVIQPTEYDTVANALTRVTLRQKAFLPVLQSVTELEFEQKIQRPTTILRSNSLPTKMQSAYCRIVGKEYLVSVLQSIISEIIEKDSDFEIDPARLSKVVDPSFYRERGISSSVIHRQVPVSAASRIVIQKKPIENLEVVVPPSPIVESEDTHPTQESLPAPVNDTLPPPPSDSLPPPPENTRGPPPDSPPPLLSFSQQQVSDRDETDSSDDDSDVEQLLYDSSTEEDSSEDDEQVSNPKSSPTKTSVVPEITESPPKPNPTANTSNITPVDSPVVHPPPLSKSGQQDSLPPKVSESTPEKSAAEPKNNLFATRKHMKRATKRFANPDLPDLAPESFSQAERIAFHQKKLLDICTRILKAITSSKNLKLLPFGLRSIAAGLQDLSYQFGLDNFDSNRLIGGFLLLRFIIPSIVVPIGTILPETATVGKHARRTLVLVSKILQSTSNGVYFNKEPYLLFANPFVKTSRPVLHHFYQLCACPPSNSQLPDDFNSILHGQVKSPVRPRLSTNLAKLNIPSQEHDSNDSDLILLHRIMFNQREAFLQALQSETFLQHSQQYAQALQPGRIASRRQVLESPRNKPPPDRTQGLFSPKSTSSLTSSSSGEMLSPNSSSLPKNGSNNDVSNCSSTQEGSEPLPKRNNPVNPGSIHTPPSLKSVPHSSDNLLSRVASSPLMERRHSEAKSSLLASPVVSHPILNSTLSSSQFAPSSVSPYILSPGDPNYNPDHDIFQQSLLLEFDPETHAPLASGKLLRAHSFSHGVKRSQSSLIQLLTPRLFDDQGRALESPRVFQSTVSKNPSINHMPPAVAPQLDFVVLIKEIGPPPPPPINPNARKIKKVKPLTQKQVDSLLNQLSLVCLTNFTQLLIANANTDLISSSKTFYRGPAFSKKHDEPIFYFIPAHLKRHHVLDSPDAFIAHILRTTVQWIHSPFSIIFDLTQLKPNKLSFLSPLLREIFFRLCPLISYRLKNLKTLYILDPYLVSSHFSFFSSDLPFYFKNPPFKGAKIKQITNWKELMNMCDTKMLLKLPEKSKILQLSNISMHNQAQKVRRKSLFSSNPKTKPRSSSDSGMMIVHLDR